MDEFGFDRRQPCQWVSAWLYGVVSADDSYAHVAWADTAASLQQRVIDELDSDVYLDDLVDNPDPRAHSEWDEFAPQMRHALSKRLPGFYHDVPAYAYADPGPSATHCTVLVSIGVQRQRTTRADFAIHCEWDGEDWRVTDIDTDVPTGYGATPLPAAASRRARDG